MISPSHDYKHEYLEMIHEWRNTGEHLVPFVLRMDSNHFEKMIDDLLGFSNGINIPKGFVTHSTFWLVNTNKEILGVANIRHNLNERLLLDGGHIGYGVTPSQRQKGYATKLLQLAIIKAKEMGLTKVLLVCNKENVGSRKTIINNGGILESEEMVDGVWIQRYWITI